MLFYEVYLCCNSKYAKLEEIITDLSKTLSEKSAHDLVKSITTKFLGERDILFSLNADLLIEKLRNTKLLWVFKWRDELKNLDLNLVAKFNANPRDEVAFKPRETGFLFNQRLPRGREPLRDIAVLCVELSNLLRRRNRQRDLSSEK